MPDKHTPWMLHDMEIATVVTARKPGKFICLCNGRSFDEEANIAHAALIVRAVNHHKELVGELEAVEKYISGWRELIAELDDMPKNEAVGKAMWAGLDQIDRTQPAIRVLLAKVEANDG